VDQPAVKLGVNIVGAKARGEPFDPGIVYGVRGVADEDSRSGHGRHRVADERVPRCMSDFVVVRVRSYYDLPLVLTFVTLSPFMTIVRSCERRALRL
jgi:hypothetical protein